MTLPDHKTKIVCTMGRLPIPGIMHKLLLAGMNVARINFSHGDFSSHGRVIAGLRQPPGLWTDGWPFWLICPALKYVSAPWRQNP